MKDGDACSRHINTLIYRYLVHPYSIRCRGIISLNYVYSYDVFHYCSKVRHVTVSTTTLAVTSSNINSLHTLHNFSLRFFQSLSLFYLSM